MTTRKYKPYPTRKQQKSRRMRNIGMTLIAVIVAIVIFIRTTQKQPAEDTVIPYSPAFSGTPQPPAEPGPIEVLNPAVKKTTITPEPAPAPKPTPTPSPVVEVVEVPTPKPAPQPKPQPKPRKSFAASDAQDNESSQRAKDSVDAALRLRDAGKIIEARELLNDTLSEKLSSNLRREIKFQLIKLAEKWLFSETVFPGDALASSYQVQRGDNFEAIAKRQKVPYEILLQINGIARPEHLRAGQHIKVLNGPFNAVIYKSNFTMDLYLQDRYIKTYRVGLGSAEYETPSGHWRASKGGKLIKPTWTDPDTGRTYVGSDPDYPLGSRWIAIEGIDETTRSRTGFALHGTKDPGSIGTRSSRGCVRLYNGDVVEVYNLLYGGISEVQIKD